MCAAPGSKTAQLIEMMNEGSENELPCKFHCCPRLSVNYIRERERVVVL